MSKKLQANNDKNAFAIVDDDVFEIIKDMKLKFGIDNKGYFRSTTEIKLPEMKKRKRLLLHHFVWLLKAKTKPSLTIDHADINKSNNQFENLRLATIQEQQHNQGKRKNNTSDYIGVSSCHVKSKNGCYDYWVASIMKLSSKREVKTFPYTENGKIAAAHWYDTKAIEYFGEFHGELNFQSHDN